MPGLGSQDDILIVERLRTATPRAVADGLLDLQSAFLIQLHDKCFLIGHGPLRDIRIGEPILSEIMAEIQRALSRLDEPP